MTDSNLSSRKKKKAGSAYVELFLLCIMIPEALEFGYKEKKVTIAQLDIVRDYLYFLDLSGIISKAKMKNY